MRELRGDSDFFQVVEESKTTGYYVVLIVEKDTNVGEQMRKAFKEVEMASKSLLNRFFVVNMESLGDAVVNQYQVYSFPQVMVFSYGTVMASFGAQEKSTMLKNLGKVGVNLNAF